MTAPQPIVPCPRCSRPADDPPNEEGWYDCRFCGKSWKPEAPPNREQPTEGAK